MGTNSEARKRGTERDKWLQSLAAARRHREKERRRELLRDALAEVWSGADFTDADAVLDHLTDRGVTLEVQP